MDDLGADSAHSSPRGQVGSGSDSGVAKLLWASVSSTRKWESWGYLAELGWGAEEGAAGASE